MTLGCRFGGFQFISYDVVFKNVVATLIMPVKVYRDRTTDPYLMRGGPPLIASAQCSQSCKISPQIWVAYTMLHPGLWVFVANITWNTADPGDGKS